MKANWITCGITAGLVILTQTASTMGEEAVFRPGICLGVMASPGGNSYMKDHGGDAQVMFLDFVVSGKIRFDDNWAVVPSLELASPMDLVNAEIQLLIPSLNLRYSFSQEPSLYVQAGPSYSSPAGGGTVAEFTGKFGGGVTIGYAFKNPHRRRIGLQLEVGYNYVPVETTTLYDAMFHSYSSPSYGPDNRYTTIKSTENFGGPFARVGVRF